MSKSARTVINKGGIQSLSVSGVRNERFTEIGYKAVKKGKCSVCGKRRQVTKEFTQTLSPFNKNSDGTLKTVEQVAAEELNKLEAWEDQDHVCSECACMQRAKRRAEEEAGRNE